jgi:hypothetical protein
MDMTHYFTAQHVFGFILDTPIPYREGRGDPVEIDKVEININWYEEDEEGPAGWNIDAYAYGWPLTSKGTRDKRIKDRERVFHYRYPVALREPALEAYATAVTASGIDPDLILNPHEGLLDPEKYLDAGVSA